MKRTKLRPMSAKMRDAMSEYREKKAIFFENHPTCPITGEIATDIHHICGRGKYLNEENTWIAISRKAHDAIHFGGQKLARECGLLQDGKSFSRDKINIEKAKELIVLHNI